MTGAADARDDRHALARSRHVWALALGQMLGYACFYYIFAALLLALEADLGWDRRLLAAGPATAIVLSAALAPLMGRLVDRGRAGQALVWGGILGAASLVVLALADRPHVYLLAWAGLGLAQAASLYEVCFAFLIRRLGPQGQAAIIRVTLVAGFASTLAFPAGAVLSAHLGWRGAVWVAVGVAALVMVPLQAWGARGLGRHDAGPDAAGRAANRAGLRLAWRRASFWALALIFAVVAVNHWMLMTFAVPIFIDRGASPALAVLAASCIGPAQVAGRLLLMRHEARIGIGQATAWTVAATVLAAACLWAAGLEPQLVFVFAALQGAALGVMTILRPVLIRATMGDTAYGTIAGIIQMPALLAGAAAPLLGAVIIGGWGVGGLIWVSLGLSGGILALVIALRSAAGPLRGV